ncbi:MAG TPA: hypothetical protein DHW36_15965 [Thalassospira sp.]|nr:hypothetical protein [Thalassospira sp.]
MVAAHGLATAGAHGDAAQGAAAHGLKAAHGFPAAQGLPAEQGLYAAQGLALHGAGAHGFTERTPLGLKAPHGLLTFPALQGL